MNLGKVLHGWRFEREINVREAGKIIGVSSATISRLENGRPITGETMSKIITWLIAHKQQGACQ